MSESFRRRSVRSSQTLSERFQAARRLRGKSLEEVARDIDIQVSYLRWIEEGQFDRLPAGVYARGFVKRYAQAMRLPEEEMLELYDHERGVTTHLRKARGEEEEEVAPVSTKKTTFLFSPRVIRLSVIGILLLVVFGYFLLQFRSLSAPPSLVVEAPSEDQTIEATQFTVRGRVEEGSRLLLNGSDVRVGADGIFSVDVPLEKGENHLRFVATSPVQKETVLERTLFVP